MQNHNSVYWCALTFYVALVHEFSPVNASLLGTLVKKIQKIV